MDKIILKRMQFYGYHGLLPEENTLGQRFYVDADLYLSLKKAGQSDAMEDSVHYGEAYEKIKHVVEGERFHLIEAVAEAIADELFTSFEQLEACSIRLTKPDPPIPGYYESVAVEIYRERTK
ncbi:MULTISPECIES: dihydroneopterin aldolase [Oceanobacillus]|uniref:7,8-dihydroneopterin aldolase n=1 Tax=Oceanobacillus aidingensis TaxID=645964 RepID=A0ABV9JTC1_9BACI|nr:dihydroneopterin aldolase [Oceanobacillus oncorhynchi]MDM8101490.1 dihydroneopterin aldolase [Oceanobacillus oncorhynchi]UUI40117.1 dihydroneopterin aldolase [Oceanobacillus oncorhynchi]